MTNILDVLYKKHKMWLNYVKSFGCPDDVAEDFVQEMYLKIHSYSQRKDNDIMFSENDVNYYFVYVTLKNLYTDNLRRKKRNILVDLTDDYIQDETEYNEGNFDVQKEAMQVWIDNLNKEIDSIESYTRVKANLIYIRFIFQKVFIERLSVSELSREVGITYWSLRNTVLIIKQQIKDEI